MRIWDRFEGGSIEVLDAGGAEAQLALVGDAGGFVHGFSFRAAGPGRHRFRVANAGASSYPEGWEDYRVCASDDGKRWFRVPTSYDGETLAFTHQTRGRVAHYASFPPYGETRRARLAARVARSTRGALWPLGSTEDGRSIAAMRFGDGEQRVWVIARQHPGEAMGEWLAEGLVGELLRPGDEAVADLCDRATVTVVPCMNPDGAAMGNHRCNGGGFDLNRSWDDPDEDETPEVAAVQEAMRGEGVDLFLDVHGDETEPYCFIARSEGNPGYDARIAEGEEAFVASLLERSDDFQDEERGYPIDPPGEADLSIAAGWVGTTFGCPALTLEMPFKDARNAPRPRTGWSPERSVALGRAVARALRDAL